MKHLREQWPVDKAGNWRTRVARIGKRIGEIHGVTWGALAIALVFAIAAIVLRLLRVHPGGDWASLLNAGKNAGAGAAAGAAGAAGGAAAGGKSRQPGDPIPGPGFVYTYKSTPMFMSDSTGSPIQQMLPPDERLVFHDRIEDANGRPTWYEVMPPVGPPGWVSADSVSPVRPGQDPNAGPMQILEGGKVESATVFTTSARG